MTRKISLTVNDVPINLDYFVEGFIDHVISGIIGSLHDTGEIETLMLNIDNEGQVTLDLNGCDIPLKYFPNDIIRSTILGMISPLKGVEGEANRLELIISR